MALRLPPTAWDLGQRLSGGEVSAGSGWHEAMEDLCRHVYRAVMVSDEEKNPQQRNLPKLKNVFIQRSRKPSWKAI